MTHASTHKRADTHEHNNKRVSATQTEHVRKATTKHGEHMRVATNTSTRGGGGQRRAGAAGAGGRGGGGRREGAGGAVGAGAAACLHVFT